MFKAKRKEKRSTAGICATTVSKYGTDSFAFVTFNGTFLVSCSDINTPGTRAGCWFLRFKRYKSKRNSVPYGRGEGRKGGRWGEALQKKNHLGTIPSSVIVR